MADPVEIAIVGMDAFAQRLSSLAQQMPLAVGNALRAEAEIEMTEAKQRTPVWNPARPVPKGHTPGQLRASGHVTGPDVSPDGIVVTLSFGGPAVDYAVYVHEDLEAHHRTGQAKFLESVLLESVPYLAARVAERIQAGLGASFAPTAAEVAENTEAVTALNQDLGIE